MKFIGFSSWVQLKEQAPVKPQGAIPAGRKDDVSQANSKIKQTIAANLTDPKRRKTALQNLAKQMAMDPNSKPEDLENVAKAMGDSDNQSKMLKK